MNRFMILGAGIWQLPLIRRCASRGLEVIAADNIPGNIGHAFAHRSLDISTVDVDRVIEAAMELKIDAISTMASDVAVPSVAAVAARLGLNGPSPRQAGVMCQKSKFRALQHEHGLPTVPFHEVGPGDDVPWGILKSEGPWLVKPVDSSGSRGVFVLDADDDAHASRAVQESQRFSRSSRVCIERFVEGTSVSGDGFLHNGDLSGACITHKIARGFVVHGHELPSPLELATQREVFKLVESTCAALGYLNGPVDFDVVIGAESNLVIELAPRLGGNGIPELIERATSHDLIDRNISWALGEDVAPSGRNDVQKTCGSMVVGSPVGGRLESLTVEADLRRDVEEVANAYLPIAKGQEVEAHEHGGAAIGYVVFDIPPGATYSDIATRIKRALKVRVE